MMPFYDTLPRWLRVIGRTLRLATYVLVGAVGVGDLFLPTPLIAASPARVVWACALVVMAAVTLVVVTMHLWRWEWVLVFWLAAVFALRAAAVWAYPGPPPQLAAGAIVTYVVVSLILRGIDLTVFAFRTSPRWRRVRVRRA